MEIKKWVYIKGPKAARRLDNLLKLAKEETHGNWSELVNESLNHRYNLDPVTGERLPGKAPCECNKRTSK